MYSWLVKSGSIIALKTKFLRINYLLKLFFYLTIVKTVVANLQASIQNTNIKQHHVANGVCISTHKLIMLSFPAASVNIAPVVSFLMYTTYSSKTVVSPMTTKIIGGTVINEIADTISTMKLQHIHFQCKYTLSDHCHSRDDQLEFLTSSLQHVKWPSTSFPGKVGGEKVLPFTGLASAILDQYGHTGKGSVQRHILLIQSTQTLINFLAFIFHLCLNRLS